MKLELLTRATGWYGRHSGYYERLPDHLAAAGLDMRITAPVDGWRQRLLGRLLSLGTDVPRRNQSLMWAEHVFRSRIRPDAVGHVLAFESHLPLFRREEAALRRTVVTVHFPPEMLKAPAREALRRVAAAVVLYRRDLGFFADLVGADRVRFVRHGVDAEFFRPADTPPADAPPRLAYVGQFCRDTAQAARVIPRLLRQFRDLRIDMVLARPEFRDAALLSLEKLERIEWHYGVPDAALRAIYQRAAALLLPMRTSGANNTIVEALACGLPVVTNDIGGIRDYGGDECFPVLARDDDDGMIQLVEHWLTNEPARRVVAGAARALATERLRWAQSAGEHLAAYRAFFG